MVLSLNWTPYTAAADPITPVAMVYGNGVYVKVGSSAGATTEAAYSADGVNWTPAVIPLGTYTSVAWNGSVFCAVCGATNTDVAATSPDGITWTARTLPASAYWETICSKDGLFLAAGATVLFTTIPQQATSPDGINWTLRPIGDLTYSGIGYPQVCSIANSSIFVLASQHTANREFAWTSPDGINWTKRTLPNVNPRVTLAVCGELIAFLGFEVGGLGYLNNLLTTTDGITWIDRGTLPQTLNVANSVGIIGNNQVFLVYGKGVNIAYISTDGVAWTLVSFPGAVQDWRGAASDGSYFAVVSHSAGGVSYTGMFSSLVGGVTADAVITTAQVQSNISRFSRYNCADVLTFLARLSSREQEQLRIALPAKYFTQLLAPCSLSELQLVELLTAVTTVSPAMEAFLTPYLDVIAGN